MNERSTIIKNTFSADMQSGWDKIITLPVCSESKEMILYGQIP